jgi:hypothetical protein
MKNKIFESINIFATGMSAADWAWRLITIAIIGGSGTLTGFFASESPLFKELGILAWVAIGLIGAISVSLIFYLVKAAQNQSAMAEYTHSVSQPKNRVNPLQESFKDQIIPVEELRVPGVQVHENKHFTRCKFVGPAAIAIMGCRMINSSFIDGGDIIPLPENTFITGIIVLKDCTIEGCEFYRTTMMISERDAKNIADSIPGIKVAGL